MADSNMQLNWTDDQWNRVREVVYEEARRARVAGNFLPLSGPLDPEASTVPKQIVTTGASGWGEMRGVRIHDRDTLQLTTLQELVLLRGAQVADPALSSALVAFRRAANLLARREDRLIFNGRSEDNEPNGLPGAARDGAAAGTGSTGSGIGPGGEEGLVAAAADTVAVVPDASRGPGRGGTPGDALVSAVSEAIARLEERHHLGPFVCALGHRYFLDAQTPDGTAVLPQDRILSFLGGGALVRTSVIAPQLGLVIALGGAPIELVVATDIAVGFLQMTPEPLSVFRVYEKIALRIKQPTAIVALRDRRSRKDAVSEDRRRHS
jgi:uncharacterized linocin/CFP29 family protein